MWRSENKYRKIYIYTYTFHQISKQTKSANHIFKRNQKTELFLVSFNCSINNVPVPHSIIHLFPNYRIDKNIKIEIELSILLPQLSICTLIEMDDRNNAIFTRTLSKLTALQNHSMYDASLYTP